MFYDDFLKAFAFEATSCQDRFFRAVSDFLSSDDGDILVVNGYAGTGKTSAVSAVINSLISRGFHCTLLAPTGRAAKVLSQISGHKASTIHKGIYRQKSVGEYGRGEFTLSPNKAKHCLFVVDEASLIGVDSSSLAAFGSGNLLSDLVTFVRSGEDCRLMLIGDSAQLPPVGMEESPALDPSCMDAFGGVSYVELSTVVRQGEMSGILKNATDLRLNLDAGRLALKTKGYEDVQCISGSELIEALSDAYGTYGDDQTIVVCRSNRKAIRYNLGIRSMVEYKEEKLLRGDKLMVVKNCYQFVDENSPMGYIANGDVAILEKISDFEQRYGLHFANATLSFPDYDNETIRAKVLLDTLESENAALSTEQQNALFEGVSEDYSHIRTKAKRYREIREDPYYNALQLKYASALTCHKSQGGQWDCVFIDCPFWEEELSRDDLKWMYTAITRAVKKLYLVNFNKNYLDD